MAGMPLLLIAFIVVPIIEIAVIDQVQASLGWPVTLLLLFLDSVIGAVLVRREGRRAWHAFREALGSGRWPGDEVTQGALVLIGGTLLVTPGFVTDAVGLALVLPPTRALISRFARKRMTPPTINVIGNFGGGGGGPSGRGPSERPGVGPSAGRGPTPPPSGSGDVVDVEVVSVERDEDET